MFGNDSSSTSFVSGAFDNISRAYDGKDLNPEWMKGPKKPAAPAAPSLVTAPPQAAPAMVDTPGRHKTLLGA